MTLKAIIPSGQTEITVNGLHQWDYGQKLEIHSADLGAIVEVHFACAGMKEAVVRVCEDTEGVAVATIPDRCLEQTTPITAWVFEKNKTENATVGLTTKTITLPIIPRTKPQPGASVPEDHTDTYAELIGAVNTAVSKLTDGSVKVNYAYNAGHAVSATSADNATTASTAAVADHATEATTVDAARKTVTTTSTTVKDSLSTSVEFDADSTYIIEAPDGSGVYVSFVLHIIEGGLAIASCTSYSIHHILSYDHQTKTLYLRRYRFLPDDTGTYEIGYQTFGVGTYKFTYAKIANLI